MISVKEALSIVQNHFYRSTSIKISINDSLGYFLAEDVFSKINMPPFPQSAMDGYALKLHNKLTYRVIGEVKAGDAENIDLQEGEAVRIFTGAPVPNSADSVIMQEKTDVQGNTIKVNENPSLYQNIRPLGEQIKEGEKALQKGSVLSPSAISFLVSLGVSEIEVYQKPSIGIVVTGSELIDVSETLTYGKIYESNSVLLKTTLQKEGIQNINIYKVADNYAATKSLLEKVLSANDFVLVSGGISVGDYDFVGKALKELQTDQLFYKIKQKPGKPLFFGKNKQTYVFALPGNPASALTCFYIYVLPILRFYSGNDTPFLKREKHKLSHDFQVKGIRAQFLKAKIETSGVVSILSQQSSAMISGFIEANAYVFVRENSGLISAGNTVETIILE